MKLYNLTLILLCWFFPSQAADRAKLTIKTLLSLRKKTGLHEHRTEIFDAARTEKNLSYESLSDEVATLTKKYAGKLPWEVSGTYTQYPKIL